MPLGRPSDGGGGCAAAAFSLSAAFFLAAATAAAAAARRCCTSRAVRGGGIGGGWRGVATAAADALDLTAAGAVFAADFLTSPGVGTGVEQVSATLPELLPGAAVQSAAVVRRIRNGGTGHGDRCCGTGAGGGSAAAGVAAETADRCCVVGGGCCVAVGTSAAGAAAAAAASGSCTAAAAEVVNGGVAVANAADAIGLAISKARPLGVQIFRTCPCRLI